MVAVLRGSQLWYTYAIVCATSNFQRRFQPRKHY
jgi:hypothetical protein